ncbi:MAG: ABC transporter permease [Acidobacteria bacterium]|nr:ABC transporter permease [Acidobacteriota bacterium]
MPDWRARVTERLAAEGLPPGDHREVIEEITDHLGLLERDYLRAGRSEAEAAEAVARELERMQPVARAMAVRRRRRSPSLTPAGARGAGAMGDLRQAVRLVWLRPAFSALVIGTLGLGVGLSTAVFSVFDAMLLGPLPFSEPDRLVLLWDANADNAANPYIVSAPNYQDWTREAKSFETLALWEHITLNVSAREEPEQVPGLRTTASLFDVLRAAPALGRVFTADEEQDRHVAVISDRVWHAHFGGAPDVVGRSIRLNGLPYDVVGVMPAGFAFPDRRTGVWIPIALTTQDEERGAHSFFAAGRLRPGVTFEQARAEMDQVGRSLAARYPESSPNQTAVATRMSEFGLLRVRPMLRAVLGAALFVLLIACVNVVNLQLGQALVRRREFAVRVALGGRLSQIARQLLAENAVLAAMAGLVGVAGAWVATRAVELIFTTGFRELPMRGEVAVSLDARGAAFAVLLSMLTAVVVGLAPLLLLRRADWQAGLRAGDRGATAVATRARSALIALEVALVVVVLSAAGLMARSLAHLLAVEPGLDPEGVLTLQVSLPQTDTYGPPARPTFCADLTREAGQLPGLASVGAISHLPFTGANASRGISIDGQPVPPPGQRPSANYRLTCPGYFASVGIPLVEGRDFDEHDRREGAPVAIVNRAMQERYWPDASPVGQRFRVGGADSGNPWMTIVGVADNVRHFGLDAAPEREFYRPYAQAAWPVMTIVARSRTGAAGLERPLREALRRVEPGLPAAQARPLAAVIGASLDWRETLLRLLGAFAVIGLVLAGLGVYGVLAYFVSQRTREFGVRLALGASGPSLAGLTVRQSAWPLTLGAFAGVALSPALGGVMSSLLFEVRPGDPMVVGGIGIAIFVVALVAAWAPARRAARVDPLTALRDE